MADEQDGADKKPLARSVESLGWLASSGVQPKKRREIEGGCRGAGVATYTLRGALLRLARPAAALFFNP